MDLNRHGHSLNFYQQVRTLLKTLPRQTEKDKTALLDSHFRFVSPLTMDAPKGDVGSISRTADGRWQVEVLSRGLTGAVGALPGVYTEWLIERYYRYGDRAAKAFLDIFTHRLQCLRFLAWEKYHYYAQAEGRDDMPLSESTQALSGVLHEPSSFSDGRYASLLAPAVRSMVNLETLLGHAFAVPVHIVPFRRHWQAADEAWCCPLGSATQPLGNAPMLGRVRWEHQSRFLLRVGPLSQPQALRFFPGETDLKSLCQHLREYLGPGLDFDIELEVENSAGSSGELGNSQLGRDCCLGGLQPQSTRRLRIAKELTEWRV